MRMQIIAKKILRLRKELNTYKKLMDSEKTEKRGVRKKERKEGRKMNRGEKM